MCDTVMVILNVQPALLVVFLVCLRELGDVYCLDSWVYSHSNRPDLSSHVQTIHTYK